MSGSLGGAGSVAVDMPRVGNGNRRLVLVFAARGRLANPPYTPSEYEVGLCSVVAGRRGSLSGNVDSVVTMASIITIIHVASMGLEERRQNGMGFQVRNARITCWGIV